MAEHRFLLCLFCLVCVRVHHTQGWFWYDVKTTQAPTNPTTVGPTSRPRTEPPKTKGTSASVSEELNEVSFEGKSVGRSTSGLGNDSEPHDNLTQYSPGYSVSANLTTEREFLVASMSAAIESPQCLPFNSNLPFCTKMGVRSFKVPNFLNQSSVEEVDVVLAHWAWLLRSNCHHSLEWFFCLLLTPRCIQSGQSPPLPCRSFCEILRDSCWMLLEEGHLPVECHSLPEETHDGHRCLSISNQKEESGVSLLQLIGDPPPPGVSKVFGQDNSPGYELGPKSNIGQSAAAHFPNPFFRDFSLIFNIKPTSSKAGVLFAITDTTHNFIYIGVKLSTVKRDKQSIIFYYTEPDSLESNEAAIFSVPAMKNTWTRFAISVVDDQVSLYFNCDSYPEVIHFERRINDPLEMEAGAGVFVGHGGGADNEKFLGLIGDLRVLKDPGAAQQLCEEEEDDYDTGSGDNGASGDGEQPLSVQSIDWVRAGLVLYASTSCGGKSRMNDIISRLIPDVKAHLPKASNPSVLPADAAATGQQQIAASDEPANRVAQERKDSRVVLVLGTLDLRETVAFQVPQDLPVHQAQRWRFGVMAQFCRECQLLEDHLDLQDLLVLKDLRENLVTLEKMGKLVKLDLLVFLEALAVPDLKEKRVTEVTVIQDPVGLQDLLAPRDPLLALIGLRLWTWRALDLIWMVCGQCLGCQVHLVLLDPPAFQVPPELDLQALVDLGHLAHLVKMGLQVSRDVLVHQVLMGNQA
ncbi:hypothetical protein DNTS_017224 [Danionella cerebrum]|uniref:FZ domain-containing protein n=1 Tax=Danionella cerebrum TaxID=2873325 RepID=A0A553R1M9_9TELE|nr:hypothetical protein DNTS_017224 [Danionella translucida]